MSNTHSKHNPYGLFGDDHNARLSIAYMSGIDEVTDYVDNCGGYIP